MNRRSIIMANQGGGGDLNTIFLLRGNEIADASAYNCQITASGTPIISDNGRFDKALYWNATAAYYLDAILPKTLSGKFTVECWLMQETTPYYKNYVALCDFCSHSCFYCEVNEGWFGPAYFVGNGSAWLQTNIMWAAGIGNNTWHHVAFVGDGARVASYFNGVCTNLSSPYPTFTNANLRVGNIALAMSRYMRGYISEFRVSDIMRYTENFTPPTEPFTT